jgi:hypothetical protein
MSRPRKVLNIRIDWLINWRYQDREEYQELGCDIVDEMKDGEVVTTSWRSIWESIGYIDTQFISNWEDFKEIKEGDISDSVDLWNYDYRFFNDEGKEFFLDQ